MRPRGASPEESITAVLRVDQSGGAPPRGSLGPSDGGEPQPFQGWLGLMAAVERLRRDVPSAARARDDEHGPGARA
jgi:hypothetical protein